MARHSSFKNLIAYETYQRFFATVRARQRAHQDPVWDLGGNWEMPGGLQPQEQSASENTELFLVELQRVDGGPAIGEQSSAAVIIVDDD